MMTHTDVPRRRALTFAWDCFRFVVLVLYCVALLPSADAATYTPKLSQYAHTAWGIQDGSFVSGINSIIQSSDGYLWLATQTGLVRFDGTRFVSVGLPGGLSARTIWPQQDGSIWVGSDHVIFRLHNGAVQSYAVDGRVNDLVEEDGKIWLVRSRSSNREGPLCEVTDKGVLCHGGNQAASCANGGVLTKDGYGDLWIGGGSGVCRWSEGKLDVFPSSEEKQIQSLRDVNSIVAEDNGSLLVGYPRVGPSLGLQHFNNGKWSPFIFGKLSGENIPISALMIDRNGALWIGTTDRGIYRVIQDRVDHFGTEDGLSSDAIGKFYEDREGCVWVTTDTGLDRFTEPKVIHFSVRQGLSDAEVGSVLASRDGAVWMGSGSGLNVLRNGEISSILPKNGLPGNEVTSMLEDHTGKLWVGVDNNLTTYDGKKFSIVRKQDGSSVGVIVSVVEDSAHDIWALAVGRPYRLYRIHDNDLPLEVKLPGDAIVNHMTASSNENIWISTKNGELVTYQNGAFVLYKGPPGITLYLVHATLDHTILGESAKGLLHWKDGKWTLLNSQNGLPCDHVLSAIEDGRGFLWLHMQCGLVSIKHSDFEQWLEHPQEQLKTRLLDVIDGALPGLASFAPSVAMSNDGRLWFANDSSVQSVDPGHIHWNDLLPPVHVEQIVADHRPYPRQDQVVLPALTRDVELDYTALSLVTPQKVRFKYRLAGVDNDWQDVGTRRTAFYMNLGPGKYLFHVIACNNDGLWNIVGDSAEFTILPTFYQTLWFKLLLTLGAVLAVLGFFFYRLDQLTRIIKGRISARYLERLRIARDLHDTLIQGVQGLTFGVHAVMENVSDNEDSKREMEKVLGRAEGLLVEGRDRLRDLRSEIEYASDLEGALGHYARENSPSSAPTLEIGTTGERVPISAVVLDEVSWIGKEALANCFRHSQASRIEISIHYGRESLMLRVCDDGVGVPSEVLTAGRRTGHWGLPGMMERAESIGARLRVSGVQPQGTQVELNVPAGVAYQREKRRTGMHLWALFRGRIDHDAEIR